MARVPKANAGSVCWIFMNHHVHEKKSVEPMVTIQLADERRIYCNEVKFVVGSEWRLKTGENHDISSHVVKAYLEGDFSDVEVVS
jgi:hypothetical protein